MIETAGSANAAVVADPISPRVQQPQMRKSSACRQCDACGASITLASKRAEYKQVTVLFADVVRSMDIATTVDGERLREIMTEFFERSAVVVQSHGGTVDKFTGDGIMALFGAPVAFEDHALRGCLAALGIQDEVRRLAAEMQRRDHVRLQVRVGLNSGRVIAGDSGSRAIGYTAIGHQVGIAQRMESVAPPGGITLSESTARLVANTAVLGERELVVMKGSDSPVPIRRLLGMTAACHASTHHESTLVGRQRELTLLSTLLTDAMRGSGRAAAVVGPAGIGKSRITREAAQLATSLGVEVFSIVCEHRSSDVAFHVLARMLRAAFGLLGLDDEVARARLRARNPDATAADLLVLHVLIGIADPTVALPDIHSVARRRRRVARLVNAALLTREAPAMFVIEDAHWIDEPSETMLAEFLSVIPQMRAMVLMTYRSECAGAPHRPLASHTIELAPLSCSEGLALAAQIMGCHPSIAGLTQQVAGKAAGNPFFTEEIVRDLAERGVLDGPRGGYINRGDVAEVSVPATIEATIAARIDRLPAAAKDTLNAAAVIGTRFDSHALATLLDSIDLAALINAELIHPMTFSPEATYAFRHPLVRAVAYESQLKSERDRLHRQLAAASEAKPHQKFPGSDGGEPLPPPDLPSVR